MSAPTGNTYWRLRSKDGRDKIYETPESLVEACNEYFKWCEENPFSEAQIVKASQTEVTESPFIDIKTKKETKTKTKKTIPYVIAGVPKMRPFTIEGLCNFLDISKETFRLYEAREDFIGVTTRVKQIIYNQKFEGAASGFFNANIIARDLGLTDRTDNKQEVKLNGDLNINPDKLSKQAKREILKSLKNNG